ncbi:MAG: hypothetical protein LBI41_04995 [Lactobacillales bacterium]|jgi:methionyl-tRNA formyltransferase|nr:hypothetical protein [Lactobacillales bacterium]
MPLFNYTTDCFKSEQLYHISVLPYYRGSIAEFWQFYNNELEKVGVTLHLIDNKIDTGPIICQKRTELTPKDNYITARYKNIISAENLIKDNLEGILNKKFRATVQDSTVSDTPYKFSMITEELRYNYWHKARKL